MSFPPKVCNTSECLRSAANFIQSMNLSADPCEDFYQYTCGNWADEHPRPDSLTSFDWFSERQSRVLRNIRSYLQANSTDEDPLPVRQARDMFTACMNVTQMDALKYKPLLYYLNQFGLPKYPTFLNLTPFDYGTYKFDWIKSIVQIKRILGMDILIGFDVFPDPLDRDVNRLVVGTPETETELPL